MRQAYIVGPYSGTPEEVQKNVRDALAAAHYLALHGYLPICPHVMGPHDQTWDQAMTRCRSIIRGLNKEQDILVELPGWQNSRGSCEEHNLAFMLGLRITSLEEACAA